MADMKWRIIDRVNEILEDANDRMPKLDIDPEEIDYNFSLKGKTAGQYRRRGKEDELRFNMFFAEANQESYLEDTVVHEVAHLIQRHLYPLSSSHGIEWKNIMHFLGVKEVSRCHSYDTAVLPERHQTRYFYSCGCAGKKHHVSVRIHRKIQEGIPYTCKRCGEKIHFTGEAG